jgi:hypothetical protein
VVRRMSFNFLPPQDEDLPFSWDADVSSVPAVDTARPPTPPVAPAAPQRRRRTRKEKRYLKHCCVLRVRPTQDTSQA